jgi:homoserine kinase type II
MAVYTTVSADDLAVWLTRYALGTVHEFEPIVAGIENTNYFLTADNGRFVLTLY